MIRAFLTLLGVLFAAWGLPGYGQSCGPQALVVNILSARGLPIPGLSASSFRASSHGKAANVLSASLRNDPSTRTYVLLDTGSTMGGLGAQGIDKWKIARAAASEFLATAPPQAEISLETFSDIVGRRFPSSGGREVMAEWLNGAESLRASELKGKSAIHRTILETAEAMEPARPGDSIFVVTDGRNDNNLSMTARVADELASHGIRLFSFVLDDSRRADNGITAGGMIESSGPPNPGAKELFDLVKDSGGVGYTLYPGGNRVGQSFGVSYEYDERTHQNVRASVTEIEIAISNFYILTVGLLDHTRGLQDFQLQLVDARGKQKKDMILTFPTRIPGCPVPAFGR
jgi:hypothetical protein